ncbi:MAG: tryptophan--tRNA ligase [Bacteroidetes bacterium]|nr:tryptophan--tRNA ligase [Bacteroidota bacterium]
MSGIMPSGDLHIGNYLGAIINWVQLQHTYEAFFCVVDMHAITTPQDPAQLREKTREVAAIYLAAGIDPRMATVFAQSHVHAHAELCWVLNCVTPLGWLERMTQFKEKAGAHRERASAGLFDYPVLQAADILLYGGMPPRSLTVPVGEDQKQHVELARDIALRFNRVFGRILSVPEPFIRDAGARIMGLDDPTRKMSKSTQGSYHSIRLLDGPDEIRRKIARAVTDPGREVRFDPGRPGLYNLLSIYELLSQEPRAEIEARFAGRGYAELKQELAELVIESLRPLQRRYREIRREPGRLEDLLAEGAARAAAEADRVLAAVKAAVGLG